MRAYSDAQMKASVELIRMVSEWCWEVDQNAGRNATDFFTEDCVVEAGTIAYRGHQAMRNFYLVNTAARASMDKSRCTRHTVTNPFVRFDGHSKATLRFRMMNFAGEGELPIMGSTVPALIADSRLECVLSTEHGWLFAALRSDVLFLGEDMHINKLLADDDTT